LIKHVPRTSRKEVTRHKAYGHTTNQKPARHCHPSPKAKTAPIIWNQTDTRQHQTTRGHAHVRAGTLVIACFVPDSAGEGAGPRHGQPGMRCPRCPTPISVHTRRQWWSGNSSLTPLRVPGRTAAG
jgi:hypothetical protein